MFEDSKGPDLEQSPERTAYFCSKRSGTSARGIKGWGLESPTLVGGLAVSWAPAPIHEVPLHGQVWASSQYGSWVQGQVSHEQESGV